MPPTFTKCSPNVELETHTKRTAEGWRVLVVVVTVVLVELIQISITSPTHPLIQKNRLGNKVAVSHMVMDAAILCDLQQCLTFRGVNAHFPSK